MFTDNDLAFEAPLLLGCNASPAMPPGTSDNALLDGL